MAYFRSFRFLLPNVFYYPLLAITGFFLILSCQASPTIKDEVIKDVLPGAYDMEEYLPLLQGKKVGIVVNHTSMVDDVHLVDTLLSRGVEVSMILSPEHGFKGTAYNGEEVGDDLYQGKIPIRSLYGKSRKPAAEDIVPLDVVVFDIQDVGARFYTYIYTMAYVMETAAEVGTPVIVLDRPNPNAHYIDGPVLDTAFASFVGMHPIPAVYGMTIGEYAQMVNGEGWLANGVMCDLTIVANQNYDHDTPYTLPIPPSPNLPNQRSVLLFPSLCFFEGTVVSEGRGTDMQFQVYGHPEMDESGFTYTPRSMSSSKYPRQQDQLCQGVDLRTLSPEEIRNEGRINLSYILDAYQQLEELDTAFFLKNDFINLLAGNDILRQQILDGMSEEEIRATWQPGLQQFEKTRQKYLIY